MRSILRLFLCFFLQAAVFCVYGQEDLQKLRIEAEKGNAEAQYILGTYLFSGEKIKEDRSAAVKLFEEATSEVGIIRATSSACEGPDKTQILSFGNSSQITSESLFKVSFSKPFATFTTIP